jgi:uncharacterized protein YdeI (YjbR/CyaY-like superfamily)
MKRRDDTRIFEVPAALARMLEAHPLAASRFESLPYSHKKEFLDWIASPKKEETRTRRLEKLIPMLLATKPRGGK